MMEEKDKKIIYDYLEKQLKDASKWRPIKTKKDIEDVTGWQLG